MQGRSWIMLVVAAVLGLVAVILANSYFSGMETRQAELARQQQLARIVVATRPLAFGAKLGPENVAMKNWPANSVPEGAFRTIPDVLKDNRVSLRPIVPGEPILASKVSGTDGRATLASLLPDGMRAVTIPINAVAGVAGFVLPGTLVDVLLTRRIPGEGSTGEDMRSDVILANAKVLAVDQLADEKAGDPKVSGTATLEVSLYDAQRLIIAQRIGEMSLVLRNFTTDVAQGSSTVTNRAVGGRRIYIAARPAPAPRTAAALPARVPMAPGVPMAPMYRGPTMTVVRGTNTTDYPVGQLGAW